MKQTIDRLISEFNLKEARRLLQGIKPETIPFEERADYAELCRRAGLFRLALQFMHDLIHENKNAAPRDYFQYAACLRRMGLINESLRILDRLPPTAKANLQKAFCHVHRWDYATAAGFLLLTLESKPSETESRAARVNLAASLVVLNELESAEKWLSNVEPECREKSFHLYLNCRELRVQIAIARRDFETADHILRDCGKLLTNDMEGAARLMLEKWHHILEVARNASPANLRALAEFKAHIRAAEHWESLRSLDWELARARKDGEAAAAVYFGTPFPAFRQQILTSEFGPALPDHILRTDTRWSGDAPCLINGLTGKNMPFKFGGLTYRAALLMLSDNYQPWTVYRLFDGLFGDEAFNPFTSPNRVYQIIDRIRVEIKKAGVPLDLQNSGQGFRLRPKNEGAVVIFDEMRFLSVEEMVLRLLRIRFRERPFKLKDLTGLTPLSQTQIGRALRKLVAERTLETVSGDRKTHRYKVKAA